MAETRYTKNHEWVRLDDGVATIGITDHAQQALGDIVFVEVPEAGRTVEAEEGCAIVESVKAASDVYAPMAGTVIEGNQAIVDDPASVNRSPQEYGWFFKLNPADPADFAKLMDEDAYTAFRETA